MRVTQGMEQTQFLTALNGLESNLAQTQNEVSTGLAFTTPAEDPAAAGTVDNLNQVLAQSQQYTANANSAQTSLNTEDNALTQLEDQLQSLHSLALEANSGTQSSQDLSAIATQVSQIQNSLLSIANTQDGNGQYIFAGYATQSQPYSLTATGASYAGDDGQQKAQIAAGQTIAVGDNGNTVFNSPTGNGTYTVTANAANTGSGLIGATTVSNAAAYNGGSYTISFTSPNAYTINTLPPTTGTYTSGQAIAFDGLQISLSGQPATGDSFDVAPSTNQSIFTTVQNLVNALQPPTGTPGSPTQLSNSLADAINNINEALNQTSTVQASVGGRLNTITTQLSVATSQQTQLQTSISSLQSVDYATAVTTLDSENTQLSAAMQAFTLTQGLSLFKYIS
ncbi:MAG: flagellar hook-associated protein FlgL [Steroidobacteraceae bacterium]|jgi:flagellar hook-associated protein 3 FlgL